MKKTRKILALLMVAAMLMMITQPITSFAVASTGVFVEGSGSEEDPYLISNKYQLNNVRNDLAAHYKLTCDIEFEESDFAEGGYFYHDGAGFVPIGITGSSGFYGTFDGNGFVIKNLYINRDIWGGCYFVGLFGYNEGTIKNLGLIDGDISAIAGRDSAYAGGFAGHNGGRITNCYYTGRVSATSSVNSVDVGGIVGTNLGIISNCYNTGSLSATFRSYALVGGIAGSNLNTELISGYVEGKIESCYNTGDMLITSTNDKKESAGGITGNNIGTIANCYYLDNISIGVGSGEDPTIQCTSNEMKDKSTFVGFDFENVWTFDDSLILHQYPLLKEVAYIENIVYGDLDDDGELTAIDALMMKQYFVGMIDEDDIVIAIVDINKDGVVNSKDLLMLKQKLAA